MNWSRSRAATPLSVTMVVNTLLVPACDTSGVHVMTPLLINDRAFVPATVLRQRVGQGLRGHIRIRRRVRHDERIQRIDHLVHLRRQHWRRVLADDRATEPSRIN